MREGKVNAILLDLGNVIVKVDDDMLIKGFKPYIRKRTPEHMREYFRSGRDVWDYHSGKLDSSRFYSRMKRRFGMNIKFGAFYEVWNSIFVPYPEMEKMVVKIRKKYPGIKIVLISDTNESHYEFISREYPVLAMLDGQVLSHVVGARKPDKRMFNAALKIAGTKPKDTFYTDDRADLIEAARVMGIKAFQFTGHEKFRSDLAKAGLSV